MESNLVKKVTEGLKLAYKKMIEQKIKDGQKIVVSENGKVIHVDPNKKLPKNFEEKSKCG